MHLRSLFLLAFTLTVYGGCSDDDSSSSGAVNTTRSPACLKVQDAACDWFADGCKQVTRVECDDTFQAIFCKNDVQANACTEALSGAACGALPSQCNNLADSAPAMSLCRSFSDTFCQRTSECSSITKQSCLTELNGIIDCTRAVGIRTTYETCKAELKCVDGKVPLPESCKGLVKLSSALVSEMPPGLEVSSVIAIDGLGGL